MRVLVVDDEEDIRVLLSLYLRPRGVTVELAENAAVARARLAEGPVGLLLLDLSLPVEDGASLVRSLRAEGALPEVTVLMTAQAPSQRRAVADELGLPSLGKPFTMTDLEAVLGPMLPA